MSISFFSSPFVFCCCSFIRNTWSIQRIASNSSISHDVSKNCIDPTISYRNKKTYESTEPQLGLLKTSPTEELEV